MRGQNLILTGRLLNEGRNSTQLQENADFVTKKIPHNFSTIGGHTQPKIRIIQYVQTQSQITPKQNLRVFILVHLLYLK